MAGWAADAWRSKTTRLGVAAIFTAAVTAFFDKLDWRAALAAAFYAAFQILNRDTQARAAEKTAAAIHTNTAAVQSVANLTAENTAVTAAVAAKDNPL